MSTNAQADAGPDADHRALLGRAARAPRPHPVLAVDAAATSSIRGFWRRGRWPTTSNGARSRRWARCTPTPSPPRGVARTSPTTVPQLLAVVEWDEGPRFSTEMVNVAPEALRIGMRVQAGLHRLPRRTT